MGSSQNRGGPQTWSVSLHLSLKPPQTGYHWEQNQNGPSEKKKQNRTKKTGPKNTEPKNQNQKNRTNKKHNHKKNRTRNTEQEKQNKQNKQNNTPSTYTRVDISRGCQWKAQAQSFGTASGLDLRFIGPLKGHSQNPQKGAGSKGTPNSNFENASTWWTLGLG